MTGVSKTYVRKRAMVQCAGKVDVFLCRNVAGSLGLSLRAPCRWPGQKQAGGPRVANAPRPAILRGPERDRLTAVRNWLFHFGTGRSYLPSHCSTCKLDSNSNTARNLQPLRISVRPWTRDTFLCVFSDMDKRRTCYLTELRCKCKQPCPLWGEEVLPRHARI